MYVLLVWVNVWHICVNIISRLYAEGRLQFPWEILKLIFIASFSVPGSERLPSPNTTSISPQLWGARNGTLPPIDKTEFLEPLPRGSAVSVCRLKSLTFLFTMS
jgi:hypothetical protein